MSTFQLNHTPLKAECYNTIIIHTLSHTQHSDLKGCKINFCLFFITEVGDTVGEVGDGVGGPLVNVLLHGLEVIP